MAYEACLTEIKNATGIADMTDDEAERMLDAVLATKQRIMATRGLAANEALSAAAKEAAEREAMVAAIQKRNALKNLKTRIDTRGRIDARAQDLAQKPKLFGGARKDYLADAVGAENVAINTPTRGGRFSAEGEWHTESVRLIDPIEIALEKAGLFKAARDRSLEREWGNELAELTKRDAGEPSNVGKTKSPQALKIAEILHQATTIAKQKLNDAGAWIGDYAGWLGKTVHDGDKIRRAGFGQWRSDITPWLDRERSFEGVKDSNAYLRRIYNEFVSGYHFGPERVGMKDPAFQGPGNRAKALSQSRVLHFRDADAWLAYQKKYGLGNPLENIYFSLDQAARSLALMNRWGTNPEAEFKATLDYLRQKYTDTDPEAVRALNQAEGRLQTQFDYLTGKANQPANEFRARLNAGIRSWTSMAKLGLVGFTHLTVAATKAAELRYQGVGFLQAYGDFFKSIFEGRGSQEKRELADLLLAGHEGKRADLMARFVLDDTMPGTMSKLNTLFFKMSGLTYLLDNEKRGTQTLLARHLGSMLDRDFESLPPQTQRAFQQYDISAREWNALRNAPDHFELEDGRQALTPDAALRAEGLTQPEAERLALKLHAYYKDVADRAVVTPGIAEKAMLLRGNRPGDALGEALRYFAQFKSWPLAAARMAFGRELYGGQSGLEALGGLAHLIVASMVTGYSVMVLKDLVKGLNPRPLNDPNTYLAALMQGGGIGILGDFLFGQYNRFGRNFFETAAGPVPGEVGGTLLDVWNSAKNEARNAALDRPFKDVIGPELARTAMNNVPFVNLFYSRAALDYLLLWRIQEEMNPGWARRYERRVQQQSGQTFWLRPTQAVQ